MMCGTKKMSKNIYFIYVKKKMDTCFGVLLEIEEEIRDNDQ